MGMDYTTSVECPRCGRGILVEVHECGCSFGLCEYCGLDYEEENDCKNKEKEEK